MNGFWRDRPVLVTGAAGLLGSWLVEALLERDARVVVLLRDIVPDALFQTSGSARRSVVVLGDVADGRVVERTIVEYEIDSVFHLAAQTIVGHALRDPLSTFRSNIEGTWELLDACRRSNRATRVVVASSDKAYGSQAVLPYTEDQPLEGRHPYDVSKSCADLIAQTYATTYELPVVVTRCGNLYGGGDLNFNRLVPGAVRAALAGEHVVLRSDGTPVRDYIYVEDAVDAYLTLAERAHEPGIVGRAWNFSTESPMSSLEMAWAVARTAGRPDLGPVIEGTATHEIQEQYLSAAAARRDLGWAPAYGLEVGLRRTIEWYRGYLGRQLRAVA
ncbi:MAG: rfbG [Actinomycetia bacterium]|jgi:CDP-glucose 4,6-dehydratase|nr:rfbG [Actinomycetes bacterium]